MGGGREAPDYCFRIGGVRKFFVEAKKPSVHLKDDMAAAFQVRRYAWSAKLPLSILTDFQEFAVYDCRSKPHKFDKPSVGRTLYVTYRDFATRWQEIADIFSKEAVLKGSFDKYAQAGKGRRGTAEVDDAFLKEIEAWREMLAHNIALRNPRLTVRELNFAVQRTIDRLIFLRICEDRGIEIYGTLQSHLNGENVYARLCERFRRADEKYNSGLFHFTKEKGRREEPDELTLALKIDDKPLKEMIRNLYYPDCPYEFSVLPADILGQVYEQFLGKVIRLTDAHQARVEDKPEVKKAGGVYYTPTYIVDYIVKNTVGKLVAGKTPRQVAKFKILDPACGSGSFLIGAYQCLLDWHRDWYVKDGAEKWAARRSPALFRPRTGSSSSVSQGKAKGDPLFLPFEKGGTGEDLVREKERKKGGDWRLTSAERKRILLNNIYGVDIDTQAVEVTKLSLLLKVLEGESEETLVQQRRFWHERALPDLGNNIKCGNSLIAPDFYDDPKNAALGTEERLRINAFDWNAEFPEIMKAGGFDAVIGNPPYIRVRIFRELYPEQVPYLESHYHCATHVWDIYLLCFERAYLLTKRAGRFSFIVPIQTLHQPNCASLRQMLVEQTSLKIVADMCLLKVFENAVVKNCVLVCEKTPGQRNKIEVLRPRTTSELFSHASSLWPQRNVAAKDDYSLKVELLSPLKWLCEKLRAKSRTLGELYYVTFGLRSCAKGKGGGDKQRLITNDRRAAHAKPYLEGRDIRRYEVLSKKRRYVRYLPEEMYSPRMPGLFEAEKIVSQTMLSKMRLVATFDKERYYVEQSLLCIVPHGVVTPSVGLVPSLKFALGVLNSALESFYF
ncbi:MAG: TaqI-like C-terminal specificity domain-containing protein, partial [Planctomycetota bacterium]|nr:TaqI-like C-terminal specificity domain-containing protein [Planctomycetota bacterium]